MKALKPWKQPSQLEIVQEQHIIMKRLINLENSPFLNLKQQLKDFNVHQEIIQNRKKWFLQSYKLTERALKKKNKYYNPNDISIIKSKSSYLLHK